MGEKIDLPPGVGKDELQELYDKGLSSAEIGAKFGMGRTAIWNKARAMGVEVPPRGGHNLKDLTGQRFGQLVVLSKVENTRDTGAKWKCRCDCGNITEVVRISLISGRTQSCGCKKVNMLYKGCGKLSGMYWKRVVEGAKFRNLPMDITIEDAWNNFVEQDNTCALSGVHIDLSPSMRAKRCDNTASLDRIDNTKGYTKDNIQWVHKTINMARGKLPVSEFLTLCAAVATHCSEKGVNDGEQD